MNRKEFIYKSGLAYAGLLLLPSFLSSCKKESLFEDLNYDSKVVIIGAGVAGMYAAYVLKRKGIDFTILEASSTHGGRLKKIEGFADFPIDLGAEWLHGNNSILSDLAIQAGAGPWVDNSDMKYWFGNELINKLPENIANKLESGSPADISIKAYAEQLGFGSEYDLILENLAGDVGTSASRLSASEVIRENDTWVCGETDYKFNTTFYDFINDNIAAKVLDNIQLNTIISKIDYSTDKISIHDAVGNIIEADKVIVSVPITILKDGDIEFMPSLPAEKTEAFGKIGMDAGMKVYMKFSSKFYDDNISGGSLCAAYADEAFKRNSDDAVLLGFIMGEQAEYLSGLGNDTAIVNALLGELDTMYDGQATASFVDSVVQDWGAEPFIRGAYSYSSIGIGNARKVAAKSVDSKLFFAGEAMNTNGHFQSVHGAAETGYREVINILNSIEA